MLGWRSRTMQANVSSAARAAAAGIAGPLEDRVSGPIPPYPTRGAKNGHLDLVKPAVGHARMASMAHTVETVETQDRLAARRQAAIDRTRGALTHLSNGRSLVDEVIAEGRAEARSEDRENEQEAATRRRADR